MEAVVAATETCSTFLTKPDGLLPAYRRGLTALALLALAVCTLPLRAGVLPEDRADA